MFSFAYPEFLYLLLLVPVVAALYLFARISRTRNLKRYGRIEVLQALMPDVSKYKPGIKLVLQLIAVVMIVIMLARPRVGTTADGTTTENVKGIELIVALDISNSMNASYTDDPKGTSRLQRAKLLLERLIDGFGNDKVGLIVFAGNAYSQMPVTADFTSAKMFLGSISTDMVSEQGTAIGAAIKLAMNSFSGDKKTQKSILIITDGENFEGDAVASATEAADRGIVVNVIGVGSTRGAMIPTGNGTWMKDAEGNVVTTYLNEETAQQIAKAGQGTYVNGGAGDAAKKMSEQLASLATSDMERVVYSQKGEQFTIFAWIALVFLIADLFVLERKNSWLRKINFFTKDN